MSDHLKHFPEAAGDAQLWGGGEPPSPPERPEVYICVDCRAFEGTAAEACDHHRETGHAVRGKAWPVMWDNAQFSDADRSGRRKDRGAA